MDRDSGSEEEDVPLYSPEPTDRIEPLPTYSEQDEPTHVTLENVRNVLDNPNRAREQDFNIWQRYIHGNKLGKMPNHESDTTGTIAAGFFSAIVKGQQDVIALLIENSLVSANMTKHRQTPLITAVATRDVAVVQQLLEFGADPNAFGSAPPVWGSDTRTVILRTPLQLAASMGHLVLVKILMEQYHCDDSIIAPDGQIALRLAADNNHREIVDYLPARRGGGFRRWQFRNREALRRVKKSLANIYDFVKFFVWDIEKFFLWTLPKHLIFKPVAKVCGWCWKNRNRVGPWCKHQLMETPRRIKAFGKGVFRMGKASCKFTTQKLPRWIKDTVVRLGKALWKFTTQTFPSWIKKTVVRLGKASWKFGTETFPRWIKQIALWVWKFLTIKLPKAFALLGRWVFNGLSSLVHVIWNVIMRIFSWILTVVEAVLSFFRKLTLADIWNGFCDIMRAVLAFPKLVGSWIAAFGKVSYKMLKVLFGEIGECLWYIGYGILWIVVFLPKELWKILQSLGGALMKTGHEIKVFWDPKARGLVE